MKVIRGPEEFIKVCPRCQEVAHGNWRAIFRMFGKDYTRADGLQTYCRKCRRRGAVRAPRDGSL